MLQQCVLSLKCLTGGFYLLPTVHFCWWSMMESAGFVAAAVFLYDVLINLFIFKKYILSIWKAELTVEEEGRERVVQLTEEEEGRERVAVFAGAGLDRRQELGASLALSCGYRDPSTLGTCFNAFPGALAGSWKRSRAAGPQVTTHRGCQLCLAVP